MDGNGRPATVSTAGNGRHVGKLGICGRQKYRFGSRFALVNVEGETNV